MSRSQTALAWLALLFAPALPAYLWVWPHLSGQSEEAFQVLVYLYLLAGGLLIGLHGWTPSELGFTRRGFWPGLFASLLYTCGIVLGLLATNLGEFNPPDSWLAFAWQALFFFALVALTEEWIFRGVLHTALQEWRGPMWAIWGSALAFGLYHLAGQGWRGFLATLVFGLFAALVRRRTGSFLALVVFHGLYDILVVNLLPAGRPPDLARLHIEQPLLILLADLLFLGAFLYIWRYLPSTRS